MDTDRLNRWLTLGANIAVLVGILFLAAEISQNTEMMRAQINQSRAEASMSEAQSIYNSQHIPEILVKLRQGASITAVEHERYVHLIRGLHRNWDNQLRQFREGFLDDNIPRSIRHANQQEFVGSDLALDYWEQSKLSYSDEYIIFVESVLAGDAE